MIHVLPPYSFFPMQFPVFAVFGVQLLLLFYSNDSNFRAVARRASTLRPRSRVEAALHHYFPKWHLDEVFWRIERWGLRILPQHFAPDMSSVANFELHRSSGGRMKVSTPPQVLRPPPLKPFSLSVSPSPRLLLPLPLSFFPFLSVSICHHPLFLFLGCCRSLVSLAQAHSRS